MSIKFIISILLLIIIFLTLLIHRPLMGDMKTDDSRESGASAELKFFSLKQKRKSPEEIRYFFHNCQKESKRDMNNQIVKDIEKYISGLRTGDEVIITLKIY